VVQAVLGLVVMEDVHGEVAEQGLLVHATGGRLPLPAPASSYAGPIAMDPSLTKTVATDLAPAEHATATA
jgi:hypothetical protein